MNASSCYAGKILTVDLNTGKSGELDTFYYADRFLGGRGIASGLYWDLAAPETGAYDEKNPLIISLGPLAGIPALGGSRWGIYAKSPFPENEKFCYGNLGGYFGAELKFAGYDGLVITGKAPQTSILFISDSSVSILSAEDLRGKSTVETFSEVKERTGSKAKVLSIGPAGENMVPLATVFADGDASCSGGMGAVMGSKNLKAVAVRGSRRSVDTVDREELIRIEKEIRRYNRGNVKVWGLDFMAQGPKTKKLPCYGCMANCLRVKYTPEKGTAGKFMCQSRFFYLQYAWSYYGKETDVPFHANRLCDEYGIDTWELQIVMEWLLRCDAEGVLNGEQIGLDMSMIGSYEFIRDLVTMTALKQGLGEVLARGARAAAGTVGGDAPALVKRSDPYDPRYCTVNTFLFPFETREPIQLLHEAGLVLSQWSSWAKGVEGSHISSDVVRRIARRFWGSAKAADMTTMAGKAEAAVRIQNRQYAKECLGLCDWMYPVIDNPGSKDHLGDPAIESRIASAAIGREIDEADLYKYGERVFNLQRGILLREGHRAVYDDILHEEWHNEPMEHHVADPECLVPGPGGKPVSMVGSRILMQDFEKAREEYYHLRGWDVETGLQSVGNLKDLGLEKEAWDLFNRELALENAGKLSLVKRCCRSAGEITWVKRFLEKEKDQVPNTAENEISIKGEDLLALLQEQQKKFGHNGIAVNFEGWNKMMQYYFPDINEYYVIEMKDGTALPPIKLDKPIKKPEIFYEMSTETLRAMTKGELSGFKAYQQRRLKLKASFSDMMKLQSLNNV